MSLGTFDENVPICVQSLIHDTDTTTLIPTLNPVTGPARVDAWGALSTDTVSREFQVQIKDAGGTLQVCYQFTVPAGAGTGGVATFDVLAAILPTTNQGLVLGLNQEMETKALVTLSTGKFVAFNVLGGYIVGH